MLFLKEHLISQYSWNNNNTTYLAFTGDATRRRFDRFNGDQVLFIINLYASASENFSIADGRRIENYMVNRLPLEIKSEVSVFNWLNETKMSD